MAQKITFMSWRDTGHPDGGGSERYVQEIAERLVRRGDAVTIVCARYPGATPDTVQSGVRLRRRGGRLTVYLHGLRYLLSAEGRAQDVVVDVVNGLPFAARLVRRRGIVVLIHHVHREQWRMIYPGLRGRIGWLVESRLVPALYRNTVHVTVSESTRSDLIGLGVRPELIRIVRNGVGPTPARDPSELSPTPRLCVLARLVPHKQIGHALDVVAQLLEEMPDLHLDIIGKGWWRNRLEERTQRFGIGEHVTFHGFLAAERRDQLLRHAWLMLAPSAKEGWGIAILEAAAMGTPTVAYRRGGGVAEAIVDGRTGLLAGDFWELVALTRQVLNDGQLRRRLSREAAERARAFSWETTADEFARVIEANDQRAPYWTMSWPAGFVPGAHVSWDAADRAATTASTAPTAAAATHVNALTTSLLQDWRSRAYQGSDCVPRSARQRHEE
jgi:glycosyltransferase involved in cell wall biosynthesis